MTIFTQMAKDEPCGPRWVRLSRGDLHAGDSAAEPLHQLNSVGTLGTVFPLLGVPTGRWSRQHIADALAPLAGPTTELFGAERLVFGTHSPKDDPDGFNASLWAALAPPQRARLAAKVAPILAQVDDSRLWQRQLAGPRGRTRAYYRFSQERRPRPSPRRCFGPRGMRAARRLGKGSSGHITRDDSGSPGSACEGLVERDAEA